MVLHILNDIGQMLRVNAFPLLALILVCTSAGCEARLGGSLGPDKETGMVSLVVDLQDGFAGDLVVVRLNDREVFRKEDVQTKLLLGYADSWLFGTSRGWP
jgi:hypothetical protein